MAYARNHGIKALCFDIDGTFYPKWQTNVYLVKAALRHPVFSLRYNSMRQKMRSIDGYGGESSLDTDAFRVREMDILGFKGTKDEYIDRYERYMLRPWEKAMGKIRAFRGVRENLEKAKAQGYRLAALSDFPLSDKLSILGLEGLFDVEMSTEETGCLKPSRVPFLELLGRLGIEPEEALYVGDSYRKDVEGAHNVGMHTLWIRKDARAEGHPLADLVLTTWDSFANMVLD